MSCDGAEFSRVAKYHSVVTGPEPNTSRSMSSTHQGRLLIQGHIPDNGDKEFKQLIDPSHFGNMKYNFDNDVFYYVPQHTTSLDTYALPHASSSNYMSNDGQQTW